MGTSETIFSPTWGQVKEILHWLKTEFSEMEEGFYGNRRTIWNSFKYDELAVLIQDEKVVGFIVFGASIPNSRIDICEIKPSKRNLGLGKRLVEAVIEHLAKSGAHSILADCVPASSYEFWKQFGFELIEVNSMKIRLALR